MIFYIDTTKPILEINNSTSAIHMPLKMPSHGKTIILGDSAYHKDYLQNTAIALSEMKEHIKQNHPVYIKLSDGVFIDRQKGCG